MLEIRCPVSTECLRKFYFQAMERRLSNADRAVLVSTMPGFLSIGEDCGCNNLQLVDCHGTNCFGHCAGEACSTHFATGMVVINVLQQTLWQPVWSLTYQACYGMRDLFFLKTALLKSFRLSSFVGGRGPVRFDSEDGKYRYYNLAKNGHHFSEDQPTRDHEGDDFTAFHGRERIVLCEDESVERGWCQYQGGLLVSKDLIDS